MCGRFTQLPPRPVQTPARDGQNHNMPFQSQTVARIILDKDAFCYLLFFVNSTHGSRKAKPDNSINPIDASVNTQNKTWYWCFRYRSTFSSLKVRTLLPTVIRF